MSVQKNEDIPAGPVYMMTRQRTRLRNSLLLRQNSWDLSNEIIHASSRLMELDGCTEEEKDNELRVCLYAKGVLRDEESLFRKKKFHNLLNPDSALVSVAARANLRCAQDRLRRIVENAFVQAHPEWSAGNSFVTFRDDARLSCKPHAYVERVQLSGLCYMHAPVVLQHYLVAMKLGHQVPMLDMAEYMKNHMSGKALEVRIWLDHGGDSRAFLVNILTQNPNPRLLYRSGGNELESCLKSFGPVLVSAFRVEEAFDSDTWQHLKVDVEYLKSCFASITFVQTPQTSMGSFPTNASEHVECEILDAQETLTSDAQETLTSEGRWLY
ncbi:hypothetical protein MIR68_005949 [Amoeboaphelidium protococcarum]|nr:hypothetical protein MIR68_005949 [Amoeboaphelidium protococcarum]